MVVSRKFALIGVLPGRADDALAVLDAMTGSRTATMQLLQGNHQPGIGLFGPTDMAARPIQLAQAAGAAAPASRPIPRPGMDPAARRALGQAGGGLALGAAAIGAEQAMREARERSDGETTEQAFETFRLDRNKLADVFAARAYSWAKFYGPWAYFWYFDYNLGWTGPVNETFAQAVMRHEREYPGTLGSAVTQSNQQAWDVITGLLERSSAAVGVDQQIIAERNRYSSVDDALSAKPSRYNAAAKVPPLGIWRIHHLIPFAVVAGLPVPAQQAFVAAGWNLDRAENLIPLPANNATYTGPPNFSVLPIHAGGHGQYNIQVGLWIGPIAARAVLQSPAQTLTDLTAFENQLRAYLLVRLGQIHPRLL